MLDLAITLTMFNLGLATALSPCMFPVLPSYLAFLSSSERNLSKGILSSILVFLGLMTVFILVALLFSSVLSFFSDHYLQFLFLQGIILTIFGILLVLNVFVSFTKINELSSSVHNIIRKVNNPYAASYLIGTAFAIIASPCAIILFVTAFTIIASQSFTSSVLLLFAFAIGSGLPFFVIGVIVPLLQDSFKSEDQSLTTITHYSRLVYKYLPRIAGLFVFLLGLQLVIDSQIIQNLA
ncbi:MAG: hypothetical protein HeimC3_52140 [Candidatus Heimdallarchaeota archaeon LC_3]|nr:MAG: hypothetical protein HeimC3_52140 [Candidatus Heimdallarchaeota archaeon LC_3]